VHFGRHIHRVDIWPGIFNFEGLIQGGFLTSTGQPASGISYRFDNCSQTVSPSISGGRGDPLTL
jgi:hypothetical protein